MICCEQCNAPIDLRVHQPCWNCNANTHEHRMRSDIRYLIAYSRLSSVLFALVLIATAGLLGWQTLCLVLGETSMSDFIATAVPSFLLLIIGCRLAV